MSSNDCFWSFYRQSDNTRLDGLKTVQAKAVASLIPKNELSLWMAWKEGTDSWKTMSSHQELFQNVRSNIVIPPVPPPLPERKVKPGQAGKLDMNEGNLTVFSDDLINEMVRVDTRLNTRFIKHYDVQIEHAGLVYYSKTEDVSLGGAGLQEALPDDVRGRVRARFSRKGETLDVMATIIQEQGGMPAFRLRFLSIENMDTLRNWLLSSGID